MCRGNFLRQPLWLFHAATVPKELIYIGQPHPAYDPFVADAPVIFLLQIAQQLNLFFIARTKIRMPALRWIGNMDAAVPGQQALAQPSPRSDQSSVANLARIAFAQRINLVGGELRHAIAIRFKIIDKEYV